MTLDEFIERWENDNDPFWYDLDWSTQIDLVDNLVHAYLKRGLEIARLYNDNPLNYIAKIDEFKPALEEDEEG